jgi:Tol biopolymer transport system component
MGRLIGGRHSLAVILAAAWMAVAVLAADQRSPRLSSDYPRSFPENGITLLDEWVADLDLSHDGKWLAYPRRDPQDWYMDIWAVRLSGAGRRCLTCELTVPAKHRGSVAWHPAGQFLAFSAENDDVRTRKGDRLAEPGIGLNTNLWVMTADGAKAWRLTDYETDYASPRGVIHPHFSPDGKRLGWSGPVDSSKVAAGYEWGEWAVFLADFEVQAGVPTVNNIRTLQPGEQHSYYQLDDWSADGKRVLVSANPRPGQSVSGQDIYELEIETGAFRALTRTNGEWDQYAHYSPGGRQVLWASSRGLNVRFHSIEGVNWRREIKTELWMMNRDGTGARRLTYFNESGWRDHSWFQSRVAEADGVFAADNAFLPDRSRVAVALAYETKQGQWNSVLAILDLARRPATP